MPFLSERDREDIIFGIETGFDFIAASFTRTAEDIMEIGICSNGMAENGSGLSQKSKMAKVFPIWTKLSGIRWDHGCPRRYGCGNCFGKYPRFAKANH